jgi:hypothetical protein
VLAHDVDASNDKRIHNFIVGAFLDLLATYLISLHREEKQRRRSRSAREVWSIYPI